VRFLLFLGALAIGFAGALFLVERKIRLRHRRLLSAAVAADPAGERVFEETRMRHLGSAFADRLPLRTPWQAPRDVEVFCTAEALFVGSILAIPIEAIEDAALVEGALRLRWKRGGELLETDLAARAQDLERLRREIHLRQKNVVEKLVAMLGPKP